MEVIWSDLALQQLDTVVDYVEENFGVMTAQKSLRKILDKTDELSVYSSHGIYDAKYTSLVVIMSIVHVRQSPKVVTSMIKSFLEHYERS